VATDSGAPTGLLQTPWYRRTRWILLILLLFPYIAALMVWRFKPDWPKLARYATYAYGAFVGLFILVGLVTPRSQIQTAQATPVPIQAVTVAAVAPTSVPALQATLAPTAAPALAPPVEPTPKLPAQAAATPARLVVMGAGAEGVSLRTTPGTGDRLKVLKDGDELIAVGEEQHAAGRSWQRVTDAGGIEGWVASEFVGSGSASLAPQLGAPAMSVPAAAPSAAALAEHPVAPVAPAAKPSGQAAPQGGSCPPGFLIKGNQSSSGELIYHSPGGQFYSRTNPEACFATAGAAVAAGYRASQR
jgi:hypothetical protein